MPEYPLEPDARAELIAGNFGFNTYQQKVPELYLKPEVPQIVRDHIDIAQKILRHSFFVYDFIDVAFTQVIIGLEKALRLRYTEATGGGDDELTFYKLSEWAHSLNLFEFNDKSIIDAYRKVRNGKVHDAKNTLGGIVYLNRILEPLNMINDLYEDVPLRKERNRLRDDLFKDFIDLFQRKAMLNLGDKLLLARDMTPVFINNKQNQLTYYISLIILPVPSFLKASNLLPVKNLTLTNFNLDRSAKVITATSQTDKMVITFSALDDLGQAAMKHWENSIDRINTKPDGNLEMNCDILCSFSMSAGSENFYTNTVSEFYRTS